MILPKAFEKAFKNAFLSELNYPVSLKTDIKVFPAVKILTGKIDKVLIQAEETVVNNLKLEDIEINFTEFTYHPVKFLTGNFEYYIEYGEIKFKINEKSLEKYLAVQNFLNSNDINIEISEENLIIKSTIKLLGKNIPVLISGIPIIEEENLKFKPDNVKLGLINLGDTIDVRLKNNSIFRFNFDNFPFNLSITDVFLEKDFIDIKAKIILLDKK